MNIALLPSAFYPSLGGVEEFTRNLARELGRQGHSVIILVNRWPRSLPTYECADGVPLYRLAFRTPDVRHQSWLTYALTHRLIVRQMLTVLRRHKVEMLHVNCVSSNAHYAMKAQEQLQLPLVVTLHGELTMDASKLFERSAWARDTLRKAMRTADMITACSRQTLQEADAWFGRESANRGRVIHNGIDLEESRGVVPYRHHKPYLLAIGRHVSQKGFDVLLRAIARIGQESGTTPDLILAGDGTEHENLKALASELGLLQHVTFMGRVDHTTAMKMFAGCLFFVLPSRHEPFGIVNLEAMAAGKAIVATRVGGVPEIVEHGRNGLLVNADDAPALACAIQSLLVDPAKREALGTAGQLQANLFTWRSVTANYLNVYQLAIHSAAQRSKSPSDVPTHSKVNVA